MLFFSGRQYLWLEWEYCEPYRNCLFSAFPEFMIDSVLKLFHEDLDVYKYTKIFSESTFPNLTHRFLESALAFLMNLENLNKKKIALRVSHFFCIIYIFF